MSIFKKQSVVETYPAYDIVVREASTSSGGFINITKDDILGLKKNGYYKMFQAGSVVSYALDYNECPLAALSHARDRGYELHWINALGACITSHQQAKKTLVKVEYGMKVCFEGLLATIEKDHNDNLKFVPVE